MQAATDLAYALDPALWAERAVGFKPDDWQRDLLRSDARQIILNCSRQAGKSTVAALMALHTAIYQPPALILLLSPALRQSQELFRRFKDFFADLEDAPAIDRGSALRMELMNGSRIISLPGKEATVRGYSAAALLVVDEAARVSDDLYLSIRPMLAVSGGRVVALSTPFGRRGWFFDVWSEPDNGWHKVKIIAEQVPRISDEFLERERIELGEWWYQQEYECEFSETEAGVFGADEIERAFTHDDEDEWGLPTFRRGLAAA